MPVRHRPRSEREQLELFRALPGDLAPRDAQDLMAYPFFSLAKTHRTTELFQDIANRLAGRGEVRKPKRSLLGPLLKRLKARTARRESAPHRKAS